MNAVDLCIFLTSYTLVVGFVAVAEMLRSRKVTSLFVVVVALASIVAATWVGFHLKPGDNYFGLLMSLVVARDFSALVAFGLGLAAALVWVVRLADSPDFDSNDVRRRRIKQGLAQVMLAASIVGVVIGSQAFIWKEIRGTKRDPVVRMNMPGFIVEKIADLGYQPIRLAVNDQGTVYISYDYFDEAGTMGGGIFELTPDETTGKYQKRIVADSPLLMRCYGLVEKDGELFVSRSGIFPKANQGTITYESTGTVTQLRDVDGDGYFEFAHDIVTGLPGAQGPDTMQQNNGICFAADGSLFVTVASTSNRGLDGHPWEGAILRVGPDFKEPEVYAKGFRNPWDIVIGPDNEIFVSDNDIDENPGDELNHLMRGAHYGHPYIVPNEPEANSFGFRDPILVGEHEWNFLGMAYATSPALPEEFRNCIYIADFMQHSIWKLKLEQSGDTYKVISCDTFATISSPVDIAVTPSGEFFVISRNTSNVYRIRPRHSTTNKNDG